MNLKYLILLIGLIAFRPLKAENDSILRVVHISDVQLGFTSARAREKGLANDSLYKSMDERYFIQAVKAINNLSPRADLVLNTGDLVNEPENTAQWNSYLEISEKLFAPVYEVMGNHDGWSKEGLEAFQNRFKRNDYYSFKVKNCLILVLNSWYLKLPGENPALAKQQKDFAENILKEDQSLFRIMVMHFPVYVSSPEEEDAYFNIPGKEREWLLDLAAKNHVKLILSGHSHRNIINRVNDSLELITTGPISEPLGANSDATPSERGYRIIDINVYTGSVQHKFIPLAFSFAFLGDTHFDRPEHHDMNWVLRAHPADTSQIRQYCYKTRAILPVLYNDIRTLINSKGVGLVVQTGDFSEGLCGSYSLASDQMNDFIDFAAGYITVPYLLTKGNHEITGPGADSAYKQVILPFLSEQTKQVVKGSNFVFQKGSALFFFYDTYDQASLEWLENQMNVYKDMPLKFVIMHEPVIPINARSKWTEFSRTEERVNRKRLIELLGENSAIVLAGHLHCYGLVVRKTDKGAFIQLSGSSVPDRTNQQPERIITGRNNYGKNLLDLEPEFSPADRKERSRRLREEKRFVEHFEYADIQGYIVLSVKDSKVIADIYSGTGLNKWKSIDLTSLLMR